MHKKHKNFHSLGVIISGDHSCFHPLVSGLSILPTVDKHPIGISELVWTRHPRELYFILAEYCLWAELIAVSLKAIPIFYQPGNF